MAWGITRRAGRAIVSRANLRGHSAPMIGAHMVNDPTIHTGRSHAESLIQRRACQYAAAMAVRMGALPEDLSAVHAIYDARADAVRFVTQGAGSRILASYRFGDRDVQFEADARALCLPAPSKDTDE